MRDVYVYNDYTSLLYLNTSYTIIISHNNHPDILTRRHLSSSSNRFFSPSISFTNFFLMSLLATQIKLSFPSDLYSPYISESHYQRRSRHCCHQRRFRERSWRTFFGQRISSRGSQEGKQNVQSHQQLDRQWRLVKNNTIYAVLCCTVLCCVVTYGIVLYCTFLYYAV